MRSTCLFVVAAVLMTAGLAQAQETTTGSIAGSGFRLDPSALPGVPRARVERQAEDPANNGSDDQSMFADRPTLEEPRDRNRDAWDAQPTCG